MIVAMAASNIISLGTRILDLPTKGIRALGALTARKLALGLAESATGKDINTVTVEDLLLNLPMRYEDRSSFARIVDLEDGKEASLELFVNFTHARKAGYRRSFRQQLFVFEIWANDRDRTGREVVVWTFLSGSHVQEIIENYKKKFTRGTRFIAFGAWARDPRRDHRRRLRCPSAERKTPLSPGGLSRRCWPR